MRKLYGLLCALTVAAFVPMCSAADEPATAEKSAPAVTTPAAAEKSAPAVTTPAAAAPAAAALKSDKEKVSYAIGVSWGMQLKTVNLDLDMDSLVQGMRDAQAGRALALSDDDIRASLQKMQTDVQQKQQEHMKEVAAHMKELGDKNKVDGPKFLEENKKKEGVVTLPSGLQYKVIKEGEGDLPKPTDIVTVNYKGMFTDGTEFDSSFKHGKPIEVPLDGQFIPGMTDALKLMKSGAKWMVYIPPELAYGDRGMPPAGIAPNAVLVFEVEVLGIREKPKETPAAQ